MWVSALFPRTAPRCVTQPCSHAGRFVNARGADESRGSLSSHRRDVTGARAPSHVTPMAGGGVTSTLPSILFPQRALRGAFSGPGLMPRWSVRPKWPFKKWLHGEQAKVSRVQ